MVAMLSRPPVWQPRQTARPAVTSPSCYIAASHRLQRTVKAAARRGIQSVTPYVNHVASSRPQVQAAAFLFRREAPPPPDPESPEQVALRSSAGWQKSLSFVAFWLQLALAGVSAGVLIFSLAATSAASGPTWPRYFTAAGIACAFVSTFFAHGFLRLARKLSGGEVVAPGWLASSLLRCNALNVLGIAITVVGLQASVGTLVAKSLLTSAQAPYTASAANALVSLDVFSLQAATNTVLSHVVSLVFTNLMLSITSAARGATTLPAGGVAVGADGLSPVRPASLGYSPWNLKAD